MLSTTPPKRLEDFYETLWRVTLHNGDVHIVRNFVLDNFCTRYERLDLGIFHLSALSATPSKRLAGFL